MKHKSVIQPQPSEEIQNALLEAFDALTDIRRSLEKFGEPDGSGVLPLDYVACPDGVKNIRQRIELALQVLSSHTQK